MSKYYWVRVPKYVDPPVARCRVCKTKTRHRDGRGEPWCACCHVSSMRKNPRDANWKPDLLPEPNEDLTDED